MRKEKTKRVRRMRLRPQREVLRDVMLSANECNAWLTLAEIAMMTRYPAASISAQLRHLKKPRFGNYELKKRMRDGADFYSGNAHGAVWEYRLSLRQTPAKRVGRRAAKAKKRRGESPLQNSTDSAPAMAVC